MPGTGRAPRPRPFSISRLIASERVGLGPGCPSIHSSIDASSAGGMRTPRIGSRPVRGRPRGLFGLSVIDPVLYCLAQNWTGQRTHFAPVHSTELFPERGETMAWGEHKLSRRSPLVAASLCLRFRT